MQTQACSRQMLFSDHWQGHAVDVQVEGSLVKWQKWELRVGFNYREGMVLYDIGFAHGSADGSARPILHRASLPEMVVPYAEQQPPFHRRQAFGAPHPASRRTVSCLCSNAAARYAQSA